MSVLKKTKWYGSIKDGKLWIDNRRVFDLYCQGIKDGTRIEITLQKEGKDATNQQWAYLYSCVYGPFAEHFGWDLDEVDNFMKSKFQVKHLIHLPPGLELTKTGFNRDWLSKYIDFCRRVAAKEGVVTQEPNKNWRN